ncbi:MAG TPA: hypothetical protein VEJ40_00995 [Pseudolabrys sp.]|nr:hypothetical protein [Pseudolabrys sp.]
MTSRIKILSAAAALAVLLATVAVARSVHSYRPPGASRAGAMSATQNKVPARHYGNFACPGPNEADCEKLDWIPE